jgi:hypothetical protein
MIGRVENKSDNEITNRVPAQNQSAQKQHETENVKSALISKAVTTILGIANACRIFHRNAARL